MRASGYAEVKVVADIHLGILAGGGELHSDCEAELLAEGSQQENLWGVSWNSVTHKINYESIINIRARQKNYSPVLQAPAARARIAEIINDLLGGV